MYASRGAAYKSRGTASLHIHDNYHCHPEPIYGAGYILPSRSGDFADLWATSAAGEHGSDAVNAYRRAYEFR